ncbi:MAG TPA: hypothetical protein ENI87_08405 [bacterium]|nr:hypothetical protein [bacterium]
MSLLASVQQSAARNGLNLFGVVDARRFDGCQPCERRARSLQPGCDTIVVLGTAGGASWRCHARNGSAVPPGLDGDGVDELAFAGAQVVADVVRRAGYPVHLVDARRPCLNFGQLAEAAGFGIVSPISGLLLHPEYGPWLRVRAAVLLHGRPFGEVPDASIADQFRPCCTCDRPCVSACPPAVHDGFGHTDRRRCAEHRHAGGCADGCSSRMACPIGSEHRDGTGLPLHAHSVGRRTMQRWFGLGWWRVVPQFLRGGPGPSS